MPLTHRICQKGIDTEEKAIAQFWANQERSRGPRRGDPREHMDVVSCTKTTIGWEIVYAVKAPPKRVIAEVAKPVIMSAGLPNATECDGCPAWRLKEEECTDGNRPGTCPNRPKARAKTLSTTAQPIGSTVEQKGLPYEVEVSKVQITKWNPRQRFDDDKLTELAESIKAIGMLEPIIVRPKGTLYELVVGERRLRAVRDKLHCPKISAIVREMTDDEVLDAMIAENVCREDLNPIEEANHLKRVLEVGKLTQAELAARYGKTQGWVAQRLRLVEAPPELQEAIIRRLIIPSAAIEVLGQRGSEGYQQTLDDILKQAEEAAGLSFRETRNIIKAHSQPAPEPDIVIPAPKPGEETFGVYAVPASVIETVMSDEHPLEIETESEQKQAKSRDPFEPEWADCEWRKKGEEGFYCAEPKHLAKWGYMPSCPPYGCGDAPDCKAAEFAAKADQARKKDTPAQVQTELEEEDTELPTELPIEENPAKAQKESTRETRPSWKCRMGCKHPFDGRHCDNDQDAVDYMVSHLWSTRHVEERLRVIRSIREGGDTWGLLQKLFSKEVA